MNISRLQRTVFLLLLAAVTAAFVWVLSPFFGAVFWAVALTLLFHGVFERISARVGRRRNVAAILTLRAQHLRRCMRLPSGLST